MSILSIQSWVSAGHVGNAAALLPLNRLGFEVWPVNTVAFSNHPAHGGHTGRIVPAAEVQALIEGLEARGLFPACRAVLSGYLGTAGTGAAVLDAVRRVKAMRPGALYCCDPVIGDAGRVFVAPGIADLLRDAAVPAADILLPNAFEASLLSGLAIVDTADAVAAARALAARGPRTVVVTGIAQAETVTTVGVENGAAWAVRTPRLTAATHGAGDLFSALFLGFHLIGHDTREALGRAVAGVFAVIEASAGTKDLALVAAQDAMLDPPRQFVVEPAL